LPEEARGLTQLLPEGKLGVCPHASEERREAGGNCLPVPYRVCPEGVSPLLPEAKRKQKERPPASLKWR